MPAAATQRSNKTSLVEINLKNVSNAYVVFTTYYSYPISPIWFKERTHCVKFVHEWNTEIQFKHPEPQVRVRAEVAPTCDRPGRGTDIQFKDLTFKNGIAKVIGRVDGGGRTTEFCLKRSTDNHYKCEHI
jgi:hypothetical protein